MEIRSDSFEHRGRIPADFAMGAADGFGGNRNPHLAWDGVPEGTKSFALLCIDPDVPTVAAMVGRADVQIPVEQLRTDFVHWAMADIAADVREIAAGSCSDGPVVRGKQAPAGPAGARQGRLKARYAPPRPHRPQRSASPGRPAAGQNWPPPPRWQKPAGCPHAWAPAPTSLRRRRRRGHRSSPRRPNR